MLAAVALVLAMVIAAPVASEAEAGTRTFTGTGSLGSWTDVEIYMLPGTYRHELGGMAGDGGCRIAASLFPADREPPVPLQDVLQADLATNEGDPSAQGTIEVSVAGWANLQVGTGPHCQWVYAITGAFFPIGHEPPPPRAPDELGGFWGIATTGVVIAALLVLVGVRRRRTPVATEEIKVRVAPPPG